jgi:hypothetical protein
MLENDQTWLFSASTSPMCLVARVFDTIRAIRLRCRTSSPKLPTLSSTIGRIAQARPSAFQPMSFGSGWGEMHFGEGNNAAARSGSLLQQRMAISAPSRQFFRMFRRLDIFTWGSSAADWTILRGIVAYPTVLPLRRGAAAQALARSASVRGPTRRAGEQTV